ncbi:MAG: hypothetical protein P8Y63_10360 [Deltaproteobacteria bacterium]
MLSPEGTERRLSLHSRSQPGRLLVAVVFLVLQAVVLPTAVNAAAPDTNYPSVTLWPLAYHYEDSNRSHTDILWPIYLRTRTGSHYRTAIRPFLFNYETDPERDFRQLNILWPFTQFEREKDSISNWVFPLYFQTRNEHRTSIQLWPFYGHSLSGKTEAWSTLYPLFQYRHNVDMPQSEWGLDYFWPLGKWYRRGETSGSYFLPVWWRKSGPGLSGGLIFPYFWETTDKWQHKGIFPFWYRSRSQNTATDMLIPWFSYRRNNARFQTFFPLYWQKRKADGNGFSLVAPLYWSSQSDTSRLDIAFPFYFSHENLEYQTRLRYFFPFYGDYRSGDSIRHRYYLFPLYAKIDDPKQQRKAWYFLWPLVYAERTPETFQSWAVPFYWVDCRRNATGR